MDTLYNVAIYMPFAVSVIWCIMGFLKWKKTFRTWMSNLLLVMMSIYSYTTTAFLAEPANYALFPVYDVLSVFAGSLLIPCMWLYIISLKGLRANSITKTAVVVMVMSISIISGVLYIMLGKEEALLYNMNWLTGTPYVPEQPRLVALLDFVLVDVFLSFLVLEIVAFVVYVLWDSKGIRSYFGVFMDYLVRRKTVSIYHAQMVMTSILCIFAIIRVLIPEPYLTEHHLVGAVYSILLAVILAIICYTTLFNDVKEISIVDFFCPVVPSSALDEMPEVMMPIEAPELTNTDNVFGLKVNNNEEFAYPPLPENVLRPLQEAFKEYVEDGRKYLEKGLTLARIAEDIHSNKNYVSRMVHMTYDMTFPEFINKKRIEYAMRLLLEDPDIKQEVLADECGFANASAFNRAFKRETDTTPRMWLFEQKRNTQNS